MTKKYRTNEAALKGLIKSLGPVENALLRERILKIADLTEEAIAKDPASFRNPFMSEKMYLQVCKTIKEHLEFQS